MDEVDCSDWLELDEDALFDDSDEDELDDTDWLDVLDSDWLDVDEVDDSD